MRADLHLCGSRTLEMCIATTTKVHRVVGARPDKWKKKLTFDFERMPLEPSIQTYSAMTAPFWGKSRYFLSCV